MVNWQLQDAKNRLSEVVTRANQEGPQCITLRGKEAAVVLSVAEYRRLIRRQGPLSTFLRESPLLGETLDLTRSGDTGRDLEL